MNTSTIRRSRLLLASTGLLVAAPLAVGGAAFASGHDDGPGHDRGDDRGHHGRHHDGRDDRRGDDDGVNHDRGDDHGRHGRHHDDRVSASGRDGVRAAGSCSGTSTWTLKAKADDGRIEVEAEVDSNVVGQTWAWRLADDGVRVAKGTSTTAGPSGSFSVQRRIADRAGADAVVFRATFGTEVCRGTVTL